jgi:hypothetical protein
MCPAIYNPASCETCELFRFLQAKSMSAAEIHFELGAAVYGQNVMSEGIVGQWSRMFKIWRTDFHDKERSGRPATLVRDDLFRSVDQKNL